VTTAAPYVLPDTAIYPAPLAGQDLLIFLQNWVVGITGLPGPDVSVSYQDEPVNVPASDVPAWCALIVGRKTGDAFPYVAHTSGFDHVLRHEHLDLRASFYGLGIGSQADAFAELFRDGIYVNYNRLVLTQNGFGVIEVSDLIAAPNLLKERWQYKTDLTVTLSREIRRAYPVPDIIQAIGTIEARDYEAPFTTETVA
jgi:hypothetical protein